MTWTPVLPGGAPVVAATDAVKSTVLSKRDKGRAMLKVVLTGGGDFVLDFTACSTDPEEPWTMRDTVRDMLHNLRSTDGAAGASDCAAAGALQPLASSSSQPLLPLSVADLDAAGA
eukprot:CAMPEP_0179898306 /NCGR_PEP_ID=MMETSP0982-20121206/37556_1 /TAXON_ID=483367 /ORGANISM="non described non described, Strain CCMP 2436" /LENGTH=115 /DNA_ID=CAMNT_0021795569 /DNA_START=1 /DNA_END=344 /DNA_ORIENTATION=+